MCPYAARSYFACDIINEIVRKWIRTGRLALVRWHSRHDDPVECIEYVRDKRMVSRADV
jgi:hypothetical protein